MGAVAGVFYVVSLLLVVAGIPKILQPHPTGEALASLGLPSSPALVRTLGIFEVTVGLGAVVFGGSLLAGLVAVTYAGFAGFIAVALASPESASCGCFGEADTPPSRWHLVVNISASLVALTAAVWVVPGAFEALPARPIDAVLYAGLVAMATWFSYLVLTVLPTLVPEPQ